jgi:hypothetical protein
MQHNNDYNKDLNIDLQHQKMKLAIFRYSVKEIKKITRETQAISILNKEHIIKHSKTPPTNRHS